VTVDELTSSLKKFVDNEASLKGPVFGLLSRPESYGEPSLH
jgi:hypothetical protein